MSHALAEFDDPPRTGAGDAATERIAHTLKSAGIDAPGALYDEALALAREGHLGQAQARLQMLLCLDPDDAGALLLLARVHVAQRRFAEALARLDAAVERGVLPPAGLREQIEAGVREDRVREEETRARVAAREQGEIRSLRHEARSLRSDNVRLETEITESLVREQRWKWATVGASLFGAVVILLVALSHTGAPPATPPAPEAVAAEAAGEPVAPEVAGAVATAATAGSSAAPAVAAGSPATTARVERPPAAAAPTPAPEAPVPAAATGPRAHVVGSGDTLYKLAKRYYGDASRWEEIQKANKGTLKNGKDLALGMRLTIP